ncbi:hypothetical protein FACS1894159_06860 [Bacteroidia bacterium]|nr:hypothetical protein FACS1894159_06860 [Bacteroidia bacterium]
MILSLPLSALRRVCAPRPVGRKPYMVPMKEYANELIYGMLTGDEPCMAARLGATEMLCMTNFLGVRGGRKDPVGFIRGRALPWWWKQTTLDQMQRWSGFFPPAPKMAERFCELMISDMTQVDLLGSWLADESRFARELAGAKRVMLEDLEPFFAPNPWTRALEGRKVLVVHPFAETIERQYARREQIFPDGLLPRFELKTIRAVQSIAGEQTPFADWFEALEWMKGEIDRTDYDISIIGCGAYGFPLAAHVKRMGKKSIHLAGITQLLFGILGARWENYLVWPYSNLFNPAWVRPGESERPREATKIEGACYW